MPVGNSSPGNGKQSGFGRGSKADVGALADRLPPQNLEAEKCLLGSILWDNEVLHDVVGIIRAEDFYRDTHQVIFAAIRDLYEGRKGIDAVTLAEELEKRGQFELVGGNEMLAEITGSVPHAANGKYYAEIVRQKSINRQLIEYATEIIRDGYSNEYTGEQLLESAEKKIFSIAEEQVRGDVVEINELLTQAMDRIMARVDSPHAVLSGIASGFADLDDITWGFEPGQLIILAGRPSMGKTALALNIAEHVSIHQKVPLLFVSLEMGHMEIADRLLSSRSGIDGHTLRTGRGVSHEQLRALSKAFQELGQGQILIDDTPSRNMLQIAANARRLRHRKNIGLVLVDYIQLIDSEDARDSRQEQIAKISRQLKALARELPVPVIALSQLNRAVESREDRRPRMADLRESGAIEQDADMVLLIHRPEYYDQNDQPGIAEVIVAKNRNGRTGSVKLTFVKQLTRFDNFATAAEPFDAGVASPF
jgi:replicative DNA helicase